MIVKGLSSPDLSRRREGNLLKTFLLRCHHRHLGRLILMARYEDFEERSSKSLRSQLWIRGHFGFGSKTLSAAAAAKRQKIISRRDTKGKGCERYWTCGMEDAFYFVSSLMDSGGRGEDENNTPFMRHTLFCRTDFLAFLGKTTKRTAACLERRNIK